MNSTQIKEKLLLLEDVPDFTVVLSGKKSRKVNGLYKPVSREIIIHNKNMKGESDLMYTAIHEFAHHVQCSSSGMPVSGRCHTRKFWALLHRLLSRAEEKGIYSNPFRKDEAFLELTEKIKKEYLSQNGLIMKKLGGLLSRAKDICIVNNLSFDDYSDRELGIHRTMAAALINIHNLDLDSSMGFENMKTVASIKNEDKRNAALEGFLRNESPDLVKSRIAGLQEEAGAGEADPVEKLEAEKKKIIKTISTLQNKLIEIDERLKNILN